MSFTTYIARATFDPSHEPPTCCHCLLSAYKRLRSRYMPPPLGPFVYNNPLFAPVSQGCRATKTLRVAVGFHGTVRSAAGRSFTFFDSTPPSARHALKTPDRHDDIHLTSNISLTLDSCAPVAYTSLRHLY
jgi:hypothetical protein